MSCKFICDGCNKEEEGFYNGINWIKPFNWYSRNIEHESKTKEIHACSRPCIQKASNKYKCEDLVLPI